MKLGSTISVMYYYKTTFHVANSTSIILFATGNFLYLCGPSVAVRAQLCREGALLPLLGSHQTGHGA